ncbi:SRPBCC family protein [Geodermatophilus sp. SYSU D00815]
MSDSPDDRRGVVTPEPGGGRRLVFRRSWPDPIEDIWSALTENDRLARWIGTYEGERGAGGTGTFMMLHEGDEPAASPTTIVECDPPRRLVLEWTQPEHWRVELDLSTQGGRTVLLFSQVLPTEEGVADVAAGWHWYLDKLAAELHGEPQPTDWDAFLAEVGPAYRA